MGILVLNGSPRIGGNTDIVVERLKSHVPRDRNWNHFKLSKLNISPCTACDMCWSPEPCIFKDDMTEIFDVFPETNLLIFASPIYWWSITSYMKLFIDRLYPLASSKSPISLEGKKVATILLFADEDSTTANSANTMFNRIFEYLKLKDLGRLILPGLSVKGDANNESVLKKIDQFAERIFH